MAGALDDPERLRALAARGLPDPRPEAAYDRLTRWTQRSLGATGAYISFVDAGEHVYKSVAGLRPRRRTIPVVMSTCATAVIAGEVLAVEDVRLDPRLAGHPIAGAGVRGYLAVPLITAEGQALGTLCVVDEAARAWSPAEIELLGELASATMTEIELHRSRAESAARLADAERLAVTDPLTGLANRRAFVDRLEAEIARIRHLPDGRLALVLLDLDGFKAVNDRDGHAAGDTLLIAIAACLAEHVGAGELLTRIGGDELAVLIPGASTGEAATSAERLRAAVAGMRSGITISAGAGAWRPGMSGDELTRAVDRALYTAKRHGGDRVVAVGIGGSADRGAAPQGHAATPVAPREALDLALDAVNDLLGMHVSYATSMDDEDQVILRLRGDGGSFGVADGTVIPIDGTYCHHILAGRLPQVIADVRDDPLAGAMPITESAGVGAFASVPLRLADGELVGTLCCASHDARSDLGPRDIAVLQLVARIAAFDVERRRDDEARRRMETRMAGVSALAAAIAARDHYTADHSHAVVELAAQVALALGLSEAEVLEVEHVALLHDVGKLTIPDAILHSPSPLSSAEWEIMRTHPVASETVVRGVPGLESVARAVRSEHERWDGDGYPDGLTGTGIPLAARITLACDAYHAMVSDRPYRDRLPLADARAELTRGSGSQFDPDVVAALLGLLV